MTLITLTENELISTFIALFLLLFSAYIFGKIFEYFKAPKVVGEIVGGMLLGVYFIYAQTLLTLYFYHTMVKEKF